MKRMLIILLGVLMSLPTFAFSYTYKGTTLEYDLLDEDAKTVTVSGVIGVDLTDVIIPETAIDTSYNSSTGETTVIEYPVTTIGDYAFANCTTLRSVTIPNSVTSIGHRAFYNCSSLESITIPNSVTSIGHSAFYNCSSLESITIPNSVTSIGYYAFYNCSSLESITIPNSVTSIEEKTFYDCRSLKSVTIPNSVTSIGSAAFYECRSLESITIPNSVTSIGSSAFYDCRSLESITIPTSVTSIENRVFMNCYSLKSVTLLSDAVISIGEEAFFDCRSLESITIPNSVTSIGYSAFNNCRSLESITIPNSVTSIVGGTFAHCVSLYTITIPDSLTSIGNDAFSECYSLKSITIPNSVTSIGRYAFSSCNSLKSITIPNSVISIGLDAFASCRSLIDINVDMNNSCYSSIEGVLFNKDASILLQFPSGREGEYIIPDSVIDIGEAFANCSLNSVKIPNSITTLGLFAFTGSDNLNSVTIPDSIIAIESNALCLCSNLTSIEYYSQKPIEGDSGIFELSTYENATLYIPIGAKDVFRNTMPWMLFKNIKEKYYGASDGSGDCGAEACWSFKEGTLTISGTGSTYNFSTASKPEWDYLKNDIKRVVIEPGITGIGSFAFYNYNVESVSFPDGLLQIGDHAFSGNPLTSLTLPESLEILGQSPDIEDKDSGGTFSYCSELTEITLPINLKFIGRISFGYCSRLERVNWNAKNCQREDFKALEDLNLESVFMGSPVKTVNFGPEVYGVPRYLFNDLTSLIEINTSGSINFVGPGAFGNTGWLNSEVVKYEEVIYIDNVAYAFKVDKTRHDPIVIEIRPGTTCITDLIFQDITRLEKITIPESISMVGSNAFTGCVNLEEVNWNPVKLNNTKGYNGEYLFQSTGLKQINFGPTVKELPEWFLYDCQYLTDIELPESLQIIGRRAISSCPGLTTIRIPDSVEDIGVDAFFSCNNLEKITIGKNVKTIGTSALRGLPALKTVEWNAIDAEANDYFFNESVQLTDFIVGNDVISLPDKICYGASSLKNVRLGESLEEIPLYAFWGCKSLESISFPESLLTIRDFAFAGTSLTDLVIPGNIKTIDGPNTFSNTPIKNIFFTSTHIPSFSYNIFPDTVSFYVPDHDNYTSDKYQEYASLFKPYAIADKNVFTKDEEVKAVNFTCNVPDYTMEIVKMPELSNEVGEHSTTVEAKFTGKCEFTVPFVYNYKVEKDTGLCAIDDNKALQVVGRYNLQGIPVDATYTGITILVYSDGSVKKKN